MAAIYDLIQQISDQALRERIRQELERMAKQKKFGLVYEEHIPECTPLHGVRVKRGSLVARKNGKINDVWNVASIEGDIALCLRRSTGEKAQISLSELVPVAQFGEAIYPTLQPIDSISTAPDSKLWHTLIEADNYHALQLLEYLYPGKVDCIYIDPPYNTGARDWKYNNDYVDSSDSYRHSKWLSMMEKRLRIAKRLLNPRDSVLIVTIDEKEYLHLGCLLEEMFPEARMQMVTDIINPRCGIPRLNTFTRSEEYLFILQIGNNAVNNVSLTGGISEQKENKASIWFSLLRTSSHSERKERPNLFYPIWMNKDNTLHSIGAPLPINQAVNSVIPPSNDVYPIFPIRPDGREATWNLSADTLRIAFTEGTARISCQKNKTTISYLRNSEKQRIAKGEIEVIGRDENGAMILRHKEGITKVSAPKSVWVSAAHDAGLYGTTLLSAIFRDKRFSYPKSLYAVQDTLRFFVANKPNALVLDFFAGSGTTLHAVNLLNAEDGGQRRCIMVTNNEVSDDEAKTLTRQGHQPGDPEWERLGIARYVTWPRTVCSIKGEDISGTPLKGSYLGSDTPMSDGFKANAAFFRLGFLDKTAVALGRQFKEILPILWMKSGARGHMPVVEGPVPAMFILPENEFAVLIDSNRFSEFHEKVSACPLIRTAFIITDSLEGYQEMSAALTTVADTFQLYRDYLDNFRINSNR